MGLVGAKKSRGKPDNFNHSRHSPFLNTTLHNVYAYRFDHKVTRLALHIVARSAPWSARGRTHSPDPLDGKEPMTLGEVNGTRNVPPASGCGGTQVIVVVAPTLRSLYFLLRVPLGRCKHCIDKVHIWAFGS